MALLNTWIKFSAAYPVVKDNTEKVIVAYKETLVNKENTPVTLYKLVRVCDIEDHMQDPFYKSRYYAWMRFEGIDAHQDD